MRYIRAILFPYVATTGIVDWIDILYNPAEGSSNIQTDDPWNSWIFELEGRSSMSGEESRQFLDFYGGISANRTTRLMKTDLEYDYNYNKRTFSFIDDDGNEDESVYIIQSHRLRADQIFSLTEHWSAGLFSEVTNSTRNNYDLTLMGSAGVEYNLFPYEEYAEREISFVYMAGAEFRDYSETTIFLKNEETLLEQQLRARVDFTKPWEVSRGERSTGPSFMILKRTGSL